MSLQATKDRGLDRCVKMENKAEEKLREEGKQYGCLAEPKKEASGT